MRSISASQKCKIWTINHSYQKEESTKHSAARLHNPCYLQPFISIVRKLKNSSFPSISNDVIAQKIKVNRSSERELFDNSFLLTLLMKHVAFQSSFTRTVPASAHLQWNVRLISPTCEKKCFDTFDQLFNFQEGLASSPSTLLARLAHIIDPSTSLLEGGGHHLEVLTQWWRWQNPANSIHCECRRPGAWQDHMQ